MSCGSLWMRYLGISYCIKLDVNNFRQVTLLYFHFLWFTGFVENVPLCSFIRRIRYWKSNQIDRCKLLFVPICSSEYYKSTYLSTTIHRSIRIVNLHKIKIENKKKEKQTNVWYLWINCNYILRKTLFGCYSSSVSGASC